MFFPVVLSLLLLCLGTGSAFGAESGLRLEDCIAIGRQNNLTLKRTALDVRLNRAESLRALGIYLPSVTVGYGVNQSMYYTQTAVWPDGSFVILPQAQEGERRNSSYDIRIDEVLFAGGRNRLAQKSAQLVNELRELNIELTESNLTSLVTEAYCRVKGSEKALTLSLNVIEQRRLQLLSADIRLKAGSATRLDQLQAEIDLGNALNDSISATANLQTARQNIAAVLGVPLDTVLTLAPLAPLFEPVWSVDSLLSRAMQAHPQFKSLAVNRQLEDNSYRSVIGEYMPTVSATLIYSRSEESATDKAFTLSPRNRFTRIGLQASWTLFDRFTRNYSMQSAEVRRRQADVDLLMTERNVRQAINERLARLSTLYKQYATAVKNGDLARQTLELEQERYRVGSSTVIALGVAQVGYIQAQQAIIGIETEYYITLSRLYAETGIRIGEAQ